MASYKGCQGLVKVDDVTIAQVRSWNLDETAEILDGSSMDSCAKIKKAGMTDGTGSITCLWDDADAGQNAITVKAEVELKLYPRGEEIGSAFVTFQAIITSAGVSASYDGLIEKPFDYGATGVITWGVVQ